MFLFSQGGSCDISVHKKSKDGNIEEVIPTTAKSFGGTLVDSEYEKFLETIGDKDIFKSYAVTDMEDYLEALREFEFKKRTVEKKDVRIKIPLTLDSLIRSRANCSIREALQKMICEHKVTYKNFKFCFPFTEFVTFFKNVIDDITKYIKEIFANKDVGYIKEIFMVGGFSECRIIQDALRERFKTCHFNIPADAGIAVLKGAVYLGHIPNIISKLQQSGDGSIDLKLNSLVVAAIDFGSNYSGYGFSCRHDFTNVMTNRSLSRKGNSSLLLDRDQRFYAFGDEADIEFTHLAQTSDLDSNDDGKPTENKCNDFYYFPDFNLLRLLDGVSISKSIPIEFYL